MSETSPVKYEQVIADVLQSMAGVEDAVGKHNFDPSLRHLVKLRASQINQCAFCVKMHTREARQDGETNDRLDRVVVWRHVNDFNEREKAAFAWTEALTSLDGKADLAAARAQLRKHFTEQEIGLLTATVAMINLWNRIQVSRH